MDYVNLEYQPSPLDGEIFLSEAPLPLLMQAIESQFEDPIEYRRKDYLQTFITKYNYCRENEDEDTKLEVDEYYANFVAFMQDIFYKYLQIGFPDIDDMDPDDALDLLHYTYRFFIKNIRSNFQRLLTTYLDEHKGELVLNLEDRKDITSINFKGRIEDPDDVLILSNLDLVVRDILTMDFSVDEFLSLVEDGDYMEVEFVSNAYDDVHITGNFVPNYISMTDVDFHNWLEGRVRNHILKKYSDRKMIKRILKDGDEGSAEDPITNDEE